MFSKFEGSYTNYSIVDGKRMYFDDTGSELF